MVSRLSRPPSVSQGLLQVLQIPDFQPVDTGDERKKESISSRHVACSRGPKSNLETCQECRGLGMTGTKSHSLLEKG